MKNRPVLKLVVAWVAVWIAVAYTMFYVETNRTFSIDDPRLMDEAVNGNLIARGVYLGDGGRILIQEGKTLTVNDIHLFRNRGVKSVPAVWYGMYGSMSDVAWWGVVTAATVGYGDKHPETPLGRVIGAMFMLYSVATIILAIKTMVVAAVLKELRKETQAT